MGSIHANTAVPETPQVQAPRREVDQVNAEVLALAEEGVLLAASTSPIGREIADGYSMGKNIASDNYG